VCIAIYIIIIIIIIVMMKKSQNAATNGRLLKELKEVGKKDTSGVDAKPVTEGNLRHLRGTVQGPEGTVYEGGVFDVDIVIPDQYPFVPPKMKFITKVWHPNISSQTGAICLVRTNETTNID
jgi:ubiquitin-conjugating enzyme (huntingtin interacting protein 2)